MAKHMNTGFYIDAPEPVDGRTKVQDFLDLDLIPIKYDGLETLVISTRTKYRYNLALSSWEDLSVSTADFASLGGTPDDNASLVSKFSNYSLTTHTHPPAAPASHTHPTGEINRISDVVVWDSPHEAPNFIITGSTPSNQASTGGAMNYWRATDGSNYFDILDSTLVTFEGFTVNSSLKKISFTEQDPTVGSHIKAITVGNITNWNDAYSHSTTAHLGLGITSADAYRGDLGKIAYDHSQTAHAPSDAEVNVQTDWNATVGDALLLNKPTKLTDFTNDLLTGNGDDTEFAILFKGVGNAFQYDSDIGVTVNPFKNTITSSNFIITGSSPSNIGDGGSVTGMAFDTATGILSLVQTVGVGVNVDLDGRYSDIVHTHTKSQISDLSIGDGGLTEKNFTSTLLTKLNSINSGAEVNVQSDWDAVSGDALILNKPTKLTDFLNDLLSNNNLDIEYGIIFKGVDGNFQSDTDLGVTINPLKNTLTSSNFIITGSSPSSSGDGGSVTGMSFNTTTGVLNLVQTVGVDVQVDLDGKYAEGVHTHTKSQITDFPTTWDWGDLTNVPSTFTPSAHTHSKTDITDFAHTHLWADITDHPTNLSDFTDDVVSGSYLPLSGGTLTGALTGTSATFTSSISAGDGSVYSAHLRSSSGARGIELFDYNNDVIGGLDWGTDGLFFRNSSDDYIFRAFTTDKRFALYGALTGTSATFNNTVLTDASSDYAGFMQQYGGVATILLRQYGTSGMLEVRKNTSSISMKVTDAGTGLNSQPLSGYELYVNGKGKFSSDLEGTSATFSGKVTISNGSNYTPLEIIRDSTTMRMNPSGDNSIITSTNGSGNDATIYLNATNKGVGIGGNAESGYALKITGKTRATDSMEATNFIVTGSVASSSQSAPAIPTADGQYKLTVSGGIATWNSL